MSDVPMVGPQDLRNIPANVVNFLDYKPPAPTMTALGLATQCGALLNQAAAETAAAGKALYIPRSFAGGAPVAYDIDDHWELPEGCCILLNSAPQFITFLSEAVEFQGPYIQMLGRFLLKANQSTTTYLVHLTAGASFACIDNVLFTNTNSGINCEAADCQFGDLIFYECRGGGLRFTNATATRNYVRSVRARNCVGFGALFASGVRRNRIGFVHKFGVKELITPWQAANRPETQGTPFRIGIEGFGMVFGADENIIDSYITTESNDAGGTLTGSRNRILSGYNGGGNVGGLSFLGDDNEASNIISDGCEIGIGFTPAAGGTAQRNKLVNATIMNCTTVGVRHAQQAYRTWVANLNQNPATSFCKFFYNGVWNIYRRLPVGSSTTLFGPDEPTNVGPGQVSNDGVNNWEWLNSSPVLGAHLNSAVNVNSFNNTKNWDLQGDGTLTRESMMTFLASGKAVVVNDNPEYLAAQCAGIKEWKRLTDADIDGDGKVDVTGYSAIEFSFSGPKTITGFTCDYLVSTENLEQLLWIRNRTGFPVLFVDDDQAIRCIGNADYRLGLYNAISFIHVVNDIWNMVGPAPLFTSVQLNVGDADLDADGRVDVGNHQFISFAFSEAKTVNGFISEYPLGQQLHLRNSTSFPVTLKNSSELRCLGRQDYKIKLYQSIGVYALGTATGPNLWQMEGPSQAAINTWVTVTEADITAGVLNITDKTWMAFSLSSPVSITEFRDDNPDGRSVTFRNSNGATPTFVYSSTKLRNTARQDIPLDTYQAIIFDNIDADTWNMIGWLPAELFVDELRIRSAGSTSTTDYASLVSTGAASATGEAKTSSKFLARGAGLGGLSWTAYNDGVNPTKWYRDLVLIREVLAQLPVNNLPGLFAFVTDLLKPAVSDGGNTNTFSLIESLNTVIVAAAGSINRNYRVTYLQNDGSGSYAVVLGAPTYPEYKGRTLTLNMISGSPTNSVTMSLSACRGVGANTLATFTGAGQSLLFEAVRTNATTGMAWALRDNDGVTLS